LLPLGDTLLVEGDQAAAGDGNAVGVARQIDEHGLEPAERPLCVDDPLRLRSGARKAANQWDLARWAWSPKKPRRPATIIVPVKAVGQRAALGAYAVGGRS